MADKLVFFGNERLATGVTTTAPTLQALIEAGYEVCAVVVAQAKTGASRKARKLEIAEVAESYNIPVLAPKKPAEIIDDLKKLDAAAGVLVAYGKIVPPEIINIFPKGIINIHPSLLPKHRGPTPIESVIILNESTTGVSLMQLVELMDAGPIYAQSKVKLDGTESKQQLADFLLNLGKDMLIERLPAILDGSLTPQEQDNKFATTDPRITKESAELDFTEKTANELMCQVRAHYGWPRSRAMIGTIEVIITKAHANNEISGVPGTLWFGNQQLGIHCKEGTLVIEKLIPAGKKEMPAQAFLAGYSPLG